MKSLERHFSVIDRFVFRYRFQIFFGITVQNKVCIFQRHIINQIIQLGTFVHIIGNFVLHSNRFLTITGNAITDADVVEVADALAWLLDAYMRRPTPPTPTVAAPGKSYLSDDAVIAKASAAHNGEKFCRLWEGDITGYKSHSEADAALLSILAFWCSGDKAQIDRLFRQSGFLKN